VQLQLIAPQVNVQTGQVVKDKEGNAVLDYNTIIPRMLLHYFPSGMLGLGLTALLASFMSGMAGNVTAFKSSAPADDPFRLVEYLPDRFPCRRFV
jgi:SSS family solute:Na+ symporter